MAAGEGACSSPFSAFAQSSPRALPPLGHPPFVRNARTDCLSRGSPQTERLVGPSNPRNECLVAAAAGLSTRAECFGLGRSQWTERFARLDPWIECSSVGWNLRTESFFRRKNLQTERFLVGRRNAPQAECLVGRNAARTECRVGWSRSLLWMEPLAGKRRQTQPFVGRKLPMEPLLRKRSLRPHNCTIPPRPQLGSYEAAESPSLPPPPPRPKRIILVRHGQSEGNVDESVYCRVPDSKITLTEEGWHQALACGLRIRDIAESDGVDDWKVYFYVSPYKRTLQTLRGIGTAFKRNQIAGVREEPRIREQDFGNFQDREKMRLEKEARLRYGRFFYRFPNGESAADVYDRITGFRETLRADIDIGRFQRPEARSKNMNLVIVSHGLTLRVFLMRWYKWSVKQFEGLCNFENTGMLVMQLGSGGRYSLLVHHSPEELREFGLTKEMIEDQEWQTVSKVGELNYDWVTSGSSFFSHFNTDDFDLDELPPDIARNGNNSNYITLPPPCG